MSDRTPDTDTVLTQDEKDEAARKAALNSVGPAGEYTDPNVGTIVSGMPAGGSDSLDSKTANDDDPDN